MTDEARRDVGTMLRDTPHACVMVAVEGDEPVGLAICCQSFSSFAAKPILNLHDLVVAPNRRGAGIGRRLMEAIEAEARKRGCCAMTLEIVGDNEPAKHLYRSCGFQGGDAVDPPNAIMFWKKKLS